MSENCEFNFCSFLEKVNVNLLVSYFVISKFVTVTKSQNKFTASKLIL